MKLAVEIGDLEVHESPAVVAWSVAVELPYGLLSPNRSRGQHWSKFHKRRNQIEQDMSLLILPFTRPGRPLEVADVRIHQIRRGLYDEDNLVSSAKQLIDSLVSLRILPDDAQKLMRPVVLDWADQASPYAQRPKPIMVFVSQHALPRARRNELRQPERTLVTVRTPHA